MSLLLVLVGSEPDVAPELTAARPALEAARRQGFVQPCRLVWPGGQALWYATPGTTAGSGACVEVGGRFAAYVGSVHWKGLTREALLRRLLDGYGDPAAMPLRDFSGAFAMVFSNGQETWLFNDAVGMQKLYTTADGRVLSSSMLCCRAMLQRPRVNRLRAQEYVLLGSSHALQTPIDGLHITDPTQMLELRSGRASTLHAAPDWRRPAAYKTMDDAVADLSTRIAQDFGSMLQAFGSKVGMALSGGFDSRLLLAALDHHGVAPTLYVYGRPEDDDVRIAQAKAAALGLPIEWFDKRAANAALPPLAAPLLAENIAFFDGLPVDGVFDRGTDRSTRLHQVRDGTLNLNGGGGEILRNFFYLPDRSYTAADLVGTFYSYWLPQAIADADERRAFLQATEDGILACLGFDAGTAKARARRLLRSAVELVYSLFRLRYWMGRNNSVAARYGAFLTPLPHPRLVEQAATVPLQWKSHGDLEARIIQSLSPRVASGPSNYGFDFGAGPGAAHRRHVNATLIRPVALRRRSAQLSRLLGRKATAQVPAEWQALQALEGCDWIDPRHLTEPAHINRLLTVLALLAEG